MNPDTNKNVNNKPTTPGQGGSRFSNRPGGRPNFNNRQQPGNSEYQDLYEKVVQVNRASKKNAGGDKRSLSVLVVVGDKKGKVGVGLGKAADVQSAVRKATGYARRHLIGIELKGTTIPHPVYIKMGAARILIKPARVGTGVIAGGAVRTVVEAAGVHDIVSKILGTKNQASNVYATLEALRRLKPANILPETVVKAEEPVEKKKPSKKISKA
jgi:small subunit ribosomal protein S5